MADAFHMVRRLTSTSHCARTNWQTETNTAQLNDIISLVIGLWAVSAAQKTSTDEFTFGVRLNPVATTPNAESHN